MIRGRSIWLAEMINKNHYTVGAEIGAAIGLTTSHVLSQCKGIEKYIVVDDFRIAAATGPFSSPNMKKEFETKLQKHPNFSKLKLLEGVSWEMADLVEPRSLDFVFIDASHDYDSVKKDILAWEPKVKIGGLLSGHDIDWVGVRKAVEEIHPDYIEPKINEVWYKYLKS